MFAALHLPDLTVMAALRACPEARGKPCAVLEADVDPEAIIEKVKLPLQAVTDAARETGIGPGWPLNRALVRCPDLKVLTPDPAGEAQLLREMIAQAESITPDLEVALTREEAQLIANRSYQFSEATIEVTMDIKTTTSRETNVKVSASAKVGFAAWSASVTADVSHNRKFGKEVRGTSRLFTRLAPVPPPPRIAPELTVVDNRPDGGV